MSRATGGDRRLALRLRSHGLRAFEKVPSVVDPRREEDTVYARLVRFEGADRAVMARDIEEMRTQIESESTEDPSGQLDQGQMDMLRQLVKRVLLLADREKGSSAMVVFCETADDVRRLDELFNQMSPSEGGGQRQSVDIYEVAIDKRFER